MNQENNSLRSLAIAIYHADWYYNHSDDYSVYLKGEAQVKKLRKVISDMEWTDSKRQNLWEALENLITETHNGREINPKHKEFWFNKIKQLTDWNNKND